jgi:hypothetical protein
MYISLAILKLALYIKAKIRLITKDYTIYFYVTLARWDSHLSLILI